MTTGQLYIEESFGILTDDDLYLDCILVRPPNLPDEAIQSLRVWVPKFPLTKSSVITCARQEVQFSGAQRKVAHLVFDLRGTGESEGVMGDENFDQDLHAVREWAKERFGNINFGFLGTPYSEYGRVNLWPLRPGSMMESYYYPAVSSAVNPPSLLYLSTYGGFGKTDDVVCTRLAQAGYDVYGVDPLRYLLHASAQNRLKPEDLWEDMKFLNQMLPAPPILIGQPMAAGLALLWASRVPQVKGVIAIGRAQAGFSPAHIFQNSNPYTYLLSRYAREIAPRPAALVMLTEHTMGGDEQEVAALYQSLQEPRRLEKLDRLSFTTLQELIEWVRQKGK
jgi:pimeloyl-ACP methyl ester carboxylesterase